MPASDPSNLKEVLKRNVLHTLRVKGEKKPRELAALLDSNVTDVNNALHELRREQLVAREQIARSGTGDLFIYHASAASDVQLAASLKVGAAALPTSDPSKYLWYAGRKVAKVSFSVQQEAQDTGRRGFGEVKIVGPSYTEDERLAARRRGEALAGTQYMRVQLQVHKVEGQPNVYFCEVIAERNIATYLKWFPNLHLGPEDVRG